MGRRLDLHTILQGIIGLRPDGKHNLYFQPPSTVKMNYPCIVYKRDGNSSLRADNLLYRHQWRYSVTVIESDPDSEIPDKVLQLPLCDFDRAFTADNLHHIVFNLYF